MARSPNPTTLLGWPQKPRPCPRLISRALRIIGAAGGRILFIRGCESDNPELSFLPPNPPLNPCYGAEVPCSNVIS